MFLFKISLFIPQFLPPFSYSGYNHLSPKWLEWPPDLFFTHTSLPLAPIYSLYSNHDYVKSNANLILLLSYLSSPFYSYPPIKGEKIICNDFQKALLPLSFPLTQLIFSYCQISAHMSFPPEGLSNFSVHLHSMNYRTLCSSHSAKCICLSHH